MRNPNQAALDFLLTRRSRPAKTLTTPVPNGQELDVILTAAARTPDHGKLEPWRFVVLEHAALMRLAALVGLRAKALGLDAAARDKALAQYRDGNLMVAVVESPVVSEKIPTIEQTYSAGAVCLSLVNAALAAGWGANWLTGWTAHDKTFCREAFELEDHERIAGLIHIGTQTSAPPERPRPDLAQKVMWISS